MKYKQVQVVRRGGPDGMIIAEADLRQPSRGEVRVRILAASVTQDDVAVRVGNRPVLPRLPFVPGYAVVGVVDALGEGVSRVQVGERVISLTQFGGYAEYIYLDQAKLAPLSHRVDPMAAAPIILNYLVAYQILHHIARVKAGDTALVIGASGGVGTAFLQLGKLAGLKIYGLASKRKHAALAEQGAIPIDYHAQNYAEVIAQLEPAGIDYVFNGMGEETFEGALSVLRRGGMLVHYGGPQSMARLVLLVAKIFAYKLIHPGKKIEGYGTHRLGIERFQPDWEELMRLLEQGKIKPIIAARFPILEARKANELLESGQVVGNIVLAAPELLEKAKDSCENTL